MMNKFFRYLTLGVVLIGSSLFFFSDEKAKAETSPEILAPYAVVINAKTGEIIYQKEASHHAYPASITKLMTVLLMEKNMKKNERIVATPEAIVQDPSNWFYGMHLGESMSKQDALNALMIISSNDVAMAVADHIGGSEAGFAKMMNQEATELGLKNTHFVTPNGLHDPNHYTSPYDMALIAKEVMKYPEVLEAMQAKTYMIHTDEQTAEIYRRDKIYENPLAFGGKTGFTDQAGQTIVEFEKEGNKTIIAVVMKDNNVAEYPDILAISHYAFNQIQTMHLADKGVTLKTLDVNGQHLPVVLSTDVNLESKKGDHVSTKLNVASLQTLKKGIKKRGKIGTLDVLLNGKVVDRVDLLAGKTIPRELTQIDRLKQFFSGSSKHLVTFSVFILLVLGFMVTRPRGARREQMLDQNTD
jgi:D-alanyl-D-alanine carboxypeptidase